MADTGTMMCLAGRSVFGHIRVKKHELAKVCENLTGSIGGRIKLLGAVFLNLTLGNHMCSQLVYVTPQVNCLFLSQRGCKELPRQGHRRRMEAQCRFRTSTKTTR